MIAALPLPYPFDTVAMQRALLACVAVGAFAPTIGAFLVQKRLSLVGDGVGHVAFAGRRAGLLLGVAPVWTALAFAVAGAIGVELLRAKKKVAGDLALALFFYAGIALGVVFATKAGADDLETPYLFGDPLTMTAASLAAVVVIGGIVAIGVWSLRRGAVRDRDGRGWARAEGLPVDTLDVVLAGLTAAVIVAGMKVVGLLLVAALMVLPVASAQLLGALLPAHGPARGRDRRGQRVRRPHHRAGTGSVDRRLHRARGGRRLHGREPGAPIAPGGGGEPGMSVDLDDTVEARLRDAGQRYTPQRRGLLSISWRRRRAPCRSRRSSRQR